MITIEAKGYKDNSTIQALANKTIPDELHVGFTHAQFKQLVTDNIPLHGFIGAVEVDLKVLDQDVPDGFTGRMKDEDTAYTWREFCNFEESDTKAILMVGKTDHRGNRAGSVTNTELREWVAHFSVDNMITKSDMITKIQSEYRTEQAGDV